MELSILNKSLEKHHITIEPGETYLAITIIRLRSLGGIPKIVRHNFDKAISFQEAMKKINNLCSFDDEMFDLLAQHTK